MNRVIIKIGDDDKIYQIINPKNLIRNDFKWLYDERKKEFRIRFGGLNPTYLIKKITDNEDIENYETELVKFVNNLNYYMAQYTTQTHNLEVNLTTYKIDVVKAQ